MSPFARFTGALAALAAPALSAALAAEPAKKRILHYRNPMGLADVSPVPKKDGMGMDYQPVYDRSQLILAAIDALRHTLFEESRIVALVCVIFLLHVRSALVAILMLPVGVLMAFAAMKALGIGAMVDAAIVMIENAHKHLERAAPGKPRLDILIEVATGVGPALFFSLPAITVSHCRFSRWSRRRAGCSVRWPYQDLRHGVAALLSVTLVPALMVIFVSGKISAERRNPINRLLIALYRPDAFDRK